MTLKGYKVLRHIIDNDYLQQVEMVVIGTDKQVQNDYSREIVDLCDKYKVPWFHRSKSLKSRSQYSLAVSWRWLIDATDSKIIVIHDSLLPKYRGFAPLVNQLINKETNVGVTAIFGESEYDTGDIIYQLKKRIGYPITIETAIEKISGLYTQVVDIIFDQLNKDGEIRTIRAQNNSEASYSVWRNNDDYYIDWSRSSDFIKRFVDSIGYPYLQAATMMNGRIIRISEVSIYNNLVIENRDPGKILLFHKKNPVVICGEGLIEIKKAHYEDNLKSILPLSKFRIKFSRY